MKQNRHELHVNSAFLMRKPCGAAGLTAHILRGLDTGAALTPSAMKAVLRRALEDSSVNEAILLASPVLWQTAHRVETGASLSDSQLRRAALAVLKYVIRMETRPTPFGLFAGVSRGRIDEVAKIETCGPDMPRMLVDSEWLNRVVQPLESDPDVTRWLRVRTHQALTSRAGRINLDYPSALGAIPGEVQRVAVSIRDSLPVRRALELARDPINKTVLIDELTSQFSSVDPAKVNDLVEGLISAEMLVSELRQPLDRSDDLDRLVRLLEPATALSSAAAVRHGQLRRLAAERRRFSATGDASTRAGLLAAALQSAREIDDQTTPLHVDVHVGEKLTLPAEVAREVEALADVLYRLAPERLGMRSLRTYHQDFLERYGTDRLVPILQVVDTRAPLGPPNSYENPASRRGQIDPPEPDWMSPARKRALIRLFQEAMTTGVREVVLDEHSVAQLAERSRQPMPRQLSSELYVQLVAPSLDAVTDGHFQLILGPNPGSHQAGATTARFHDILDELPGEQPCVGSSDQRRRVDLVFRPVSDRAANIAHTGQPGLPRLGCGTFDSPDHPEWRLRDIAIGANLDRMYAVHLPSGEEIVPQVSNMLSATVQAPNPMRLLFEIGHEGQRLWEPWTWGPMVDAPFLPRVRYRRSILAPATWRPETLLNGLDDPDGWASTVQAWRQRWGVPHRVMLLAADQRLLIDLDSLWHRELLRDELRRNPEQVLVEVAGDDQGWVDSDFCGHLRELVFDVHAVNQPAPTAVPATLIEDRPVQATSDDWLYLKIYPTCELDPFIRSGLLDVVDAANRSGAGSWFFIRYHDRDGYHVRLRLRTEGPTVWGRVATAAMATLDRLVEYGLVVRFDIETWDPEFERYGGLELRAAIERVFEADSVAACKLLTLAVQSGTELAQPHLVQAVSVTALAQAFGQDESGSGVAVGAACRWLGMTGTRRDLPALYRKNAKRWQALIDPAADWAGLRELGGGAEALECLVDRDARAGELAVALAAIQGRGGTLETRIIGSLMHMACNRLAGSADEGTVLGLARGAVQDNERRRDRRTA